MKKNLIQKRLTKLKNSEWQDDRDFGNATSTSKEISERQSLEDMSTFLELEE